MLDLFFTNNKTDQQRWHHVPGIADHKVVHIESSFRLLHAKKASRSVFHFQYGRCRILTHVCQSGLPISLFTFCSRLIESVRILACMVWLSHLEAIQRRAWDAGAGVEGGRQAQLEDIGRRSIHSCPLNVRPDRGMMMMCDCFHFHCQAGGWDLISITRLHCLHGWWLTLLNNNSEAPPWLVFGDWAINVDYEILRLAVSLTSLWCKLQEHVVASSIMWHLSEHVLTDCQHGFRAKHTCETQLITPIQYELANSLDGGRQTNMIIWISPSPLITSHTTPAKASSLWDVCGWGDIRPSASHQRHTTWNSHIIFINNLPDDLRSRVRLFADNCIVYRSIEK